MTRRDEHPDPADARLQHELAALCARVVEADAAPADHAALAALLADHPELIDDYIAHMSLRSALRTDALAHASAAAPSADTPASPKPLAAAQRGPGVSPYRRIPRPAYALSGIAAAVLLAAAALTVYLAIGPSLSSQPGTRDAQPDATVATILDTTGTLIVRDAVVSPGAVVEPGDLILDRGVAEFRLVNGVHARLDGPTRLTVRDPMSATLAAGSVTFDCPPDVVGFTVDLPDGSRVVDLGTRFHVAVGADATQTVEVFDGSVRIDTPDTPDAAAPTLDVHHAARYADGAWRVVDLRTLGVAERTANVRLLAFAPPSVVAGELEAADMVFLLRERAGVRVTGRLAAAITEPGEFTRERLSSGPIPPGAVVDSFLLHFDAPGDTPDDTAAIEASVTFDRPILGVIVSTGIIEADRRFAHPDTRYDADRTRGIEPGDVVTLSPDRRTLTVRLSGYQPDQLRVFVRSADADPADSTPLAPGRSPADPTGESP